MLSKLTGVLCCGNISNDIPVWPVNQFAWGRTTWVETIGSSVGGNGANTSYALATLGVPVCLIGMVGGDPEGEHLLRTLSQAGVDVHRIGRSSLPTTSTICVVHPSGDRAFLHKPGASTTLQSIDIQFDLAGFNHFHLANPFSLPQVRTKSGSLMQRARASGMTTSLDTGWDAKGRWMEDLGACLPHTDLLFVNESEAEMLTGIKQADAAAEKLRRLGVGEVIVKLGKLGCYLQGTNVCGFAVDVIDTTGAGDCFAGGFLAAIHKGWPYLEAARFANAVGALNVQHLGAAQGVLPFEATLAWIRQATSK